MMLTHWMLYALVVSAALAALTLAADHACRLYGRPTRWLWATSVGGALVLPVLTFLRAPVPAADVQVGPALALEYAPGLPAAATVPAQPPDWRAWLDVVSARGDDLLLALWLVAAVLVVGYALLSYARLRRLRRHWAEAEVDGHQVLVSDSAGPAVVGLRRLRIVLPAWVLSEPEARRRLIVAHEAEHVAAGDPRLLAAAWGALVLAPWNPVLWWQLQRLRLASELDCDARVLRKGADLRGYAGLLLDVGERFGRAPLAAAFAEHRSVLGRRLAALTARKPARRALRAVGGVALALAVAGIAGATPVPERPDFGSAPAAAAPVERQSAGQAPVALTVDAAGNYLLNGSAVSECAPAHRGTAEGKAACRLRLAWLIREARARGDSLVVVRVDATRPIRDLTEAMAFAQQAGAGRIRFDQGEKVLAPPESATTPEPPTAAAGLARVELEVLPEGRYTAAGVSLTAGQLVPFLRKLYASRADKNIYLKVNEWARYGDAVQAGAAARAAGLEIAGSSGALSGPAPGGLVPPPPPPPDMPPTPGQLRQWPDSTPYTVPPALTNRDEVRAALALNYPPLLKQAGVGGTTLVWALVDKTGGVAQAQVARTSTRAELDSAAVKVTRIMRFTPARNREEVVSVWIQLPIVFKTSDDSPARPGAALPPSPSPEQVRQGPTFTPYTVAPTLANRDEVVRALSANYPPLLRQAGVGGTTITWALVDEKGGVEQAMVKNGSGQAELDSAAVKVTKLFRFTPGMNRQQVVPVWIQLPIVFRATTTTPDSAAQRYRGGVPGMRPDSRYGIPGLPDGFTPPQLVNGPEAQRVYDEAYPPGSRSADKWAWLVLAIDASGRVTSHELAVASGNETLNRAARAVGRVLRFTPARDAAGNPAAVKLAFGLPAWGALLPAAR